MRSRVFVAAAVLVAAACATDRVQQCVSRLVSQQEASRDSNRVFFLDLTSPRGQRLVYVGVRHTVDPADPQWVTMKKAWEDLHPTIAFYEGFGTFVGDSETASIQRDGEPGLTRFLASKAGVPAYSLEPSRDEEVRVLLRQFSAEELVMFFVLRQVMEARTVDKVSGANLDAFLDRSLKAIHKTPGLTNALPNAAALRAAFAREFPGLDPMQVPPGWFDPRRTSAETGSRFFNDVNRASSKFRDEHMYRLIARALQSAGARVFAEVGRDHIPAQDAALRCTMFP